MMRKKITTTMMMMRKKMTMMMMMLTILVWCEREVNTGDVEVDVGKAGEEGSGG